VKHTFKNVVLALIIIDDEAVLSFCYLFIIVIVHRVQKKTEIYEDVNFN